MEKIRVVHKVLLQIKKSFCKTTGGLVKDIATGAGGLMIDSLAGQIRHVVLTFLNCDKTSWTPCLFVPVHYLYTVAQYHLFEHFLIL